MGADLQRWYWISCLVPVVAAVCYFAFLAVSYRRLPAQVPVHFGLNGAANGWMNRALWLIVSPLFLAFLIAIAFTTRQSGPIGLLFSPANLIFWASYGLVVGAFFEIVRSARSGSEFRFPPILLWLVLLPLCEIGLALASKPWWTAQPPH